MIELSIFHRIFRPVARSAALLKLQLLLLLSGMHGDGANLLEDNMEKLSQRQVVTILRVLYPIWMLFGIFSIMYVLSTLIVLGDAAT